MGKRPRKGGEEMDVFSRWRRVLSYTRHSRTTAKVKRNARRRERRQSRQQGFTDD